MEIKNSKKIYKNAKNYELLSRFIDDWSASHFLINNPSSSGKTGSIAITFVRHIGHIKSGRDTRGMSFKYEKIEIKLEFFFYLFYTN